ncbi:hypothetical protein Tco_1334264, partial [Tanacetum coccineum]
MHERPAGKIGLYTRFFDFANFRLPLSTFFVDILMYFRINISQLSVIGASKGDPAPKATAAPKATDLALKIMLFFFIIPLRSGSSLRNSCAWSGLAAITLWVNIDIFAFIRTPDPTKVKVVERERHEGVSRLLEVEQGDFASSGDGRDTDVQLVATTADTISEDVVPLEPSHHRKIKAVVVDIGRPSHPPKKLREDYETPGGPFVAGKSRSAIQRLLPGAVLNVEVRDSSHHSGANIAEAEVDSFTRPSVPIITAATTVTLTSGPAAVVQEKTVKPSVFAADSSSAGGDPNAGVFSDLTGSDFLVSGIRTVIDPEFDLQKVYVPRWSVTNRSRLDDGRVCREMVDEFAHPKFFASIQGMDHDQLFTEFNVRAARQVSLSAEVRMRAEYNIKEKRKLKTVVDEQADLLKVRKGEIESLRAQLLLKEAEATEVIHLRAEASSFAATEKSLRDEV